MKSAFPYPSMPQGVDERVIMPSPEFKKEVVKVAGAIAFFAGIYVALMLAAAAFAVLCGFAGFFLLYLYPSFITFMIGLGLAGLGLLVIFFLLKFIFKRSKTDLSGMIEIKEEAQPKLFGFIRNITQETQTPFPKKIYLSAEVNASVFYDSSFWSMFFPVRKNLVIGLGLVNSVNITEFKAVLAHEFGHFSQRSMKLGSYVYNVNKALHNMLYDNEGYQKLLQKWSNISGYFALFAGLTVKIVQGIQWVLQKAYVVVNRPYMSLSRQMEFHADSVAAFVSGSEPLVTSLRRIEAADICYNRLIGHYNSWLPENLKAENMYAQHRELMHRFSADFDIPMAHDLLQVNAQTLASFNQSRLVVKDQWASHPSTDDREVHLMALNVPTVWLHEPAWVLFQQAEQVQKQMTEKVYASAEFAETPTLLNLAAFTQKVTTETLERSFDKAYKGYYDNRFLPAFDLGKAVADTQSVSALPFEELFTETTCKLPEKVTSLENDLTLVQQIIQKVYDSKTFDFDGRKYSTKEAPIVQEILERDLKEAQQELQQMDLAGFQFFYRQAQKGNLGTELCEGYRNLFQATAEAEEDTQAYHKIVETLGPIYAADMPIETAKAIVGQVKEEEDPIRGRLQDLLLDTTFTRCLTTPQKEVLHKLAHEKRVYFTEYGFDNEALQVLNEALHTFVSTTWERCFQLKKDLLALQMNVVQRKAETQLEAEEA